ncbi:hypothetical protein RFI_13207, partial [Reticulomyxa filosa]
MILMHCGVNSLVFIWGIVALDLGLSEVAFGFVWLILLPYLADNRKWGFDTMMLVCSSMTGLFLLLLAVSQLLQHRSYLASQLLFVICFGGLGLFGSTSVLASRLSSKILDRENALDYHAYIEVSELLPYTVGVSVVGAMVTYLNTYYYPFFACLLMVILSFCFTLIWVRPSWKDFNDISDHTTRHIEMTSMNVNIYMTNELDLFQPFDAEKAKSVDLLSPHLDRILSNPTLPFPKENERQTSGEPGSLGSSNRPHGFSINREVSGGGGGGGGM